jgi:hypothetical protein
MVAVSTSPNKNVRELNVGAGEELPLSALREIKFINLNLIPVSFIN